MKTDIYRPVTTDEEENGVGKRTWSWQFFLRIALAIVAAGAVVVTYLSFQAREQRYIVQCVARAGGKMLLRSQARYVRDVDYQRVTWTYPVESWDPHSLCGRLPSSVDLLLVDRVGSVTLSDKIVSRSVLEGVGQAHRLEYLDLTSADFRPDDFAFLARLRHVKYLRLRGTPLRDKHLELVARLTAIEELDLGGTRVTDQGLAQLVGLPHLTTLSLSDTRITGVGLVTLAGCTPLTSLDLSGTTVDDDDIQCLASLASLQCLDARSTHVTEAGWKSLHASLLRCYVLCGEPK